MYLNYERSDPRRDVVVGRVHPDVTDNLEDMAQFVCYLARFELGKFLIWLPQYAEERQIRLGL